MLTGPFTPMLFMGEEWGARTPWQFFTDHTDPELARAVRDGRRREFGAHGWAEEDIPIRRTRPPGPAPASTGANRSGSRTPGCTPGTAS